MTRPAATLKQLTSGAQFGGTTTCDIAGRLRSRSSPSAMAAVSASAADTGACDEGARARTVAAVCPAASLASRSRAMIVRFAEAAADERRPV